MPPATRIEPGFHPYAPPTAELEVPVVDYRKVDAVASGQRLILWVMASGLAASMAVVAWPPDHDLLVGLAGAELPVKDALFSVIAIVYAVAIITGLFRVMRGLSKSWISCCLWFVFFCLPGLHFIALALINQQATNFLRGAGLKVGFLGAARRRPAPRVER